MIGKFTNSQATPYALGLIPQSSVYGATIPVYYGMTRGALYLIWQANLRQTGSSGKKFKAIKGGKTPVYGINADFLIGHNPIVGPQQFWSNSSKLGLTYSKYSTAITPGGAGSITIPDVNFYKVIAVTLTENYSRTFTDYLKPGTGSVTLSGTWEHPLWNAAFAGPDATNSSGYQNYPYVYRWFPAMGNTLLLDINSWGALPAGTLNVYYSAFNVGGHGEPAHVLNLTFEGMLGEGPEYSGSLVAQQIIYDSYAGLGSPQMDLGAAQMLPNIGVEILGAFPVYGTGDADFADMIEDVFKGYAQCSPNYIPVTNPAPAFSLLRHGLNCYEFPGCVQKVLRTGSGTFSTQDYDYQSSQTTSAPFDSFFVVAARNDAASALSLSSLLGLTYTGVPGASSNGRNVWTSPSAIGFEQVTVSPTSTNTDFHLLEFKGLQAMPWTSSATGSGGGTVNGLLDITTSPAAPAQQTVYMMAIIITDSATAQPTTTPTDWNPLMIGNGRIFSFYRIVKSPAQYAFSLPLPAAYTGNWTLVMIGFADYSSGNWIPYRYPASLGNILEPTTLAQSRAAARAYGIYGSMCLDSQKKGADTLAELYQALNAAPVWSGFSLKSIPYAEASAAGNGAYYDATQTYPNPAIANLVDNDFIADKGAPFISVKAKAQTDRPNVFQFQHANRLSDYNQVTTTQVEQSEIAINGVIKAPVETSKCIVDVGIARYILGIKVRRQNQKINTYTFTMQPRWGQLEAMDVITVTDTLQGITAIPVILTSVEEDENFGLACEAEDFIYGVSAPYTMTVTPPQPYDATSTATAVPPPVN